jgi:hypothetical protein
MTRQPFTWHGYRFEWDSFDMPHGSKERYEGWQITPDRYGARSFTIALQPDADAAKRALMKHLQEKSYELRVEADKLVNLVEDMENDL